MLSERTPVITQVFFVPLPPPPPPALHIFPVFVLYLSLFSLVFLLLFFRCAESRPPGPCSSLSHGMVAIDLSSLYSALSF